MTWPNLTKRLEGDLVVLEPLALHHEQDLLDASREPEIWRWLSGSVPSRAELHGWLAHSLGEGEAGREGPFATVQRSSGRAIGSTRYLNLRPEHRGLEIGWTWLARSAWQTGANIEAKLLMLQHAFERLDCLRVELKTDARNERSRAAMSALPAQFEGIFRAHMVVPYGDGVRDSAYYSVIASDWPQVRENLQRRVTRKRGPQTAKDAAPPIVRGVSQSTERGVSQSTERKVTSPAVRALAHGEIDLVKELWEALQEHHARVTPMLAGYAPEREVADSWRRRRAKYERWLAQPDTFVLLAERDGAPIGYAFVTVGPGHASWASGDRIAELETLSVAPGARGAGVGTLLIDEVARRLDAIGVGAIAVTTTTTNIDSHRFYQARGLRPACIVFFGPVSGL